MNHKSSISNHSNKKKPDFNSNKNGAFLLMTDRQWPMNTKEKTNSITNRHKMLVKQAIKIYH